MTDLTQMMASSPWQMWATFAVILAAIIAYSLDRYTLELVSAATLVALLFLFTLAPLPKLPDGRSLNQETLLMGFASPALFAIMGLLIIGQGMFQSGALEHPTRGLLKAYDTRPTATTIVLFVFVMIVSAFLNNTPVVVMFIPIISAMASQSKIPASRLMMPLSFLSIFGGMTTIIGSSTNLLAAQSYRVAAPGNDIGFFELTPIGLVLAGTGVVYMMTIGRALLPQRENPDDKKNAERDGKQFIAQIELRRGNPLIGKRSVAGFFPDLRDVTIRMVQRRQEALLPPFDDLQLQSGDVLIVAATRNALTALLKSQPEILDGMVAEINLEEDENANAPRAQLTLVEAIVAPGSRMIGRTIGQIGFQFQTNCVILGIERRSRMVRAKMNKMRLEAGDVLLIVGDIKDVRALRADRDILLLESSIEGLPDPRNARLAAIIFGCVVLATATGVTPIAVSAVAGAAAMVAVGCLNVRQAARAIDRRVYLLIGAALAMGASLEFTGGARLIGESAAVLASSFGTTALISTFFIVCAALTNVLSNNATAVLFTPIAVSAAESAGIDPHVLVLTIIFAANCSFATPVAYQTNLLVMTPGHYKFSDFFRVGGPLIVVLWIVYSLIAPLYFGALGKL
ncbi:MAG: SLC13 family permease [Pseudomonadota bacterium]